jgi:glutamate/tyrosine decarboxylase-like PLP-dependent enzyme
MSQEIIFNGLLKIAEQYTHNTQSTYRVVDLKTPDELNEIFQFSIDQEGVNPESFVALMEKYLAYSVNTANKQFMNQLFSGFNLPAFAGDVLCSLNNTSMYTYEVAPVATMIEQEMIKLMNSYVGYEDGDGTFLTGGSNANLIAMFSARNQKFPMSRFDGLAMQGRLKAFVSDQAHYSYDNAANVLGIGSHNIVKVETDYNGRMLPDRLELAIKASIKDGDIPFFVGATCGTTVMAAFDPLDSIAEICRKYDIWFHADGAFGGSLMLSRKNKELFAGSQFTDSFAWDAHKLMNIPLICSALLVRKRGTLQRNLSDLNTDYLYHNNSEMEDPGMKSIQCGRRVDAVKLWFALKYYGIKGFVKRIEHLMEMACHAENCVNNHPRLQLVAPRQSLTVCFRYLPVNHENVDEFNFRVRESLRKRGISMVGLARIKKELVVRLIVTNADSTFSDIDVFFSNFLRCAQELDGTSISE